MSHHKHGLENWRGELENLDWSHGWTRDELQNRFPNIPGNCWDQIPSGKQFSSFGEFWNAAQPSGAGATGSTGTMGGTMPSQSGSGAMGGGAPGPGNLGGQGPMGESQSANQFSGPSTERGGYGDVGH